MGGSIWRRSCCQHRAIQLLAEHHPRGRMPWLSRTSVQSGCFCKSRLPVLACTAERSAEALWDFGSLGEVAEVFLTAEHGFQQPVSKQDREGRGKETLGHARLHLSQAGTCWVPCGSLQQGCFGRQSCARTEL